ncbi:hypothetical protein ON010_g17496 [Phytophthora cinnamomi]|nr:hypothetical protein ON010_g17496 [Phytophthora cinnamomi]
MEPVAVDTVWLAWRRRNSRSGSGTAAGGNSWRFRVDRTEGQPAAAEPKKRASCDAPADPTPILWRKLARVGSVLVHPVEKSDCLVERGDAAPRSPRGERAFAALAVDFAPADEECWQASSSLMKSIFERIIANVRLPPRRFVFCCSASASSAESWATGRNGDNRPMSGQPSLRIEPPPRRTRTQATRPVWTLERITGEFDRLVFLRPMAAAASRPAIDNGSHSAALPHLHCALLTSHASFWAAGRNLTTALQYGRLAPAKFVCWALCRRAEFLAAGAEIACDSAGRAASSSSRSPSAALCATGLLASAMWGDGGICTQSCAALHEKIYGPQQGPTGPHSTPAKPQQQQQHAGVEIATSLNGPERLGTAKILGGIVALVCSDDSSGTGRSGHVLGP